MHPFGAINAALLAQRGNLLAWVPVCLGVGVGWYFGLLQEPSVLAWWMATTFAFFMIVCARFAPFSLAPLFIAIALVVVGAGLAKVRVEMVKEPMLTFRYYGPIEGRVIKIDRSASDAVRLTLDRVVLARMSPDRTPARVRVSLHGEQTDRLIQPGEVLMTTGHLSPPSGPAEPGGFDFQRHAFFLKLGAVGYTRNPVVGLAHGQSDWRLLVYSQRVKISRAVQKAMSGEAGAFAAAIMTGDRAAMGQATLRNLRASNLAHLLAISGLHMGLLTGVIFMGVRFLIACVPYLALRWPAKKIAAVCAIAVGFYYLLLSGGNVATERAFIMVSVMFVAVILDRRALTLRAVAMAAIVVLVIAPEALVGPGFQMSFAATTALVVVFGILRSVNLMRFPKWQRAVFSVVVSSAVAGFATAPFAAAHFNMFAHYGLIANLLSVPLMGVLVMPAAVVAACLAPFGLAWIGLWFMELGLRWILFVATTVGQADGAVGHIVAPMPQVLPVMGFGLIWIALWSGRGRLFGVAVTAVAFFLWSQTTRPALLVADNGALMGRNTNDGRALSRAKGSGFVAGIWLENDGAPMMQDQAAARAGIETLGRVSTTTLGDWRVVQVSGKTALADMSGCDGADILISNQAEVGPRPCHVFDIGALRQSGSLALDVDAQGALVITRARDITGHRPWNGGQGDDAQKTAIGGPLILVKSQTLVRAD